MSKIVKVGKARSVQNEVWPNCIVLYFAVELL